MPVRHSCGIILACLTALLQESAAAQVDQQRAEEFFTEAQALCERDGGRLWGVSLCLPMVVFDGRTQTMATSQPPPTEPRPRQLGVNAPVEWGGETWVSYGWDFVVNRPASRRNELFIHEMFHGVQPQLGLAAANGAAEHLDTLDGRYWIRLEWRALARALQETGAQRVDAVADALAFRLARRRLFAEGIENERAGEITEGLAAYTGTVVVANSTPDAIASALEVLAEFDSDASFVRTFAYASGPAYGVLLDAALPDWRRIVRATDDLGALLMAAHAIEPATDAAAVAERYGGREIRAFEKDREDARQQRLAELHRMFVEGPVLAIRGGGRGSFNSMGAVVIPDIGTVYFGPYNQSGDWGSLAAQDGVLVATDGRSRWVPAPRLRDDGTASGDGWTFTPAPGWVLREGPRPGDYEAVQQRQ